VSDRAKLLALVRLSGELQNKIEQKTFVDSDGKGVAVGTDVEHGIYVKKV
jgi:hypothetical protein